MRFPDAVTQLPQRSGRAIVSAENIATLEADFMLIYPHEGTAQDMESTPGYGELRQVKTGATVVGDMTLVQAINDPSARSRAWALDQLRTALSSVTPGS
ncbi:iron complex transport system substrate-binding protein [Bowdeniella nasicola]|uniref:Iron complex transport system substrate-binding protein n=2 Tax=Bowdeniella nasicola TaxID=208480 RepID=A0A1H3X445_9ACTO|nr:iron complex transport system substrate-binding protein [Bowdeniella nasicola]